MAHPFITAHPRLIAAAGLTGALLLPAAPVVALGAVQGETVSVTEPVCDTMEILDPLCTLLDGATQSVIESAAPAIGAVDDAVAPVAEQLPVPLPADAGEVLAGALGAEDGESTPVAPPAPGSPSSTTPTPTTGSDDGETKVEAAGKGPEEVMEPQAPTADGRVADGPTIQPLDVDVSGSNIAGIRSQNGVTLQPFDTPLVSVPMDFESPQVAGLPITTSSPVAAFATEAITFAGASVLPQTTGAAGWVTATGLGMLAGASVLVRRRATALTVSTLES